jgi:hypothetical protein
VQEYLRKKEEGRGLFGSGLPDYRPPGPESSLVISYECEYDFGWVFRFNTREYVETGNELASLVGNLPLFVDRLDGHIYTDDSTESYIEGYRSDRRWRVD